LVKKSSLRTAGRNLLFGVSFFVAGFTSHPAGAAGVTVITHGYESDTSYPAWVTAMADQIPMYFHARFPGIDANFTTYRLVVTHSGGSYYFFSTRTNGS